MPSNYLILCRSLLLLPSIFPSIRVFFNESALHNRWPKYRSFSFSISPCNEYSELGWIWISRSAGEEISYPLQYSWASIVAQLVKNLPAMWKTWVQSLGWEDHFANKGPFSQGYGFSSSHVWIWELDYKESWVPKNWCFWTVVLEKTLDSPLDGKEIKLVSPKGNQSWI